jgi:hypothetical protein
VNAACPTGLVAELNPTAEFCYASPTKIHLCQGKDQREGVKAAHVYYVPRTECFSAIVLHMMLPLGQFWQYVISDSGPRRTVTIAHIVGAITNVINHGDAFPPMAVCLIDRKWSGGPADQPVGSVRDAQHANGEN